MAALKPHQRVSVSHVLFHFSSYLVHYRRSRPCAPVADSVARGGDGGIGYRSPPGANGSSSSGSHRGGGGHGGRGAGGTGEVAGGREADTQTGTERSSGGYRGGWGRGVAPAAPKTDACRRRSDAQTRRRGNRHATFTAASRFPLLSMQSRQRPERGVGRTRAVLNGNSSYDGSRGRVRPRAAGPLCRPGTAAAAAAVPDASVFVPDADAGGALPPPRSARGMCASSTHMQYTSEPCHRHGDGGVLARRSTSRAISVVQERQRL